jgi:hypothetical protein
LHQFIFNKRQIQKSHDSSDERIKCCFHDLYNKHQIFAAFPKALKNWKTSQKCQKTETILRIGRPRALSIWQKFRKSCLKIKWNTLITGMMFLTISDNLSRLSTNWKFRKFRNFYIPLKHFPTTLLLSSLRRPNLTAN